MDIIISLQCFKPEVWTPKSEKLGVTKVHYKSQKSLKRCNIDNLSLCLIFEQTGLTMA